MAPVCTVTADQVVHDFQGDIPAGVKFRCPSCDRPVQFHRGNRASTTSADASGDQALAIRRNPRSHSSRSVHRTVRPHFRHAKNDPVARFCERYQAGLGADPRIIVRRNPRSHSSRSVHRTVRPHFRHAKNDPVARFCERYQAGLGADPRIIVPSLPMFLRKDRNRAGSGHHAQSTPTFHLEISVRRRSLGHDLISELRKDRATLTVDGISHRAGSGHHAQSTPTFHLEISVRRRSLGHDLISELRKDRATLTVDGISHNLADLVSDRKYTIHLENPSFGLRARISVPISELRKDRATLTVDGISHNLADLVSDRKYTIHLENPSFGLRARISVPEQWQRNVGSPEDGEQAFISPRNSARMEAVDFPMGLLSTPGLITMWLHVPAFCVLFRAVST